MGMCIANVHAGFETPTYAGWLRKGWVFSFLQQNGVLHNVLQRTP